MGTRTPATLGSLAWLAGLAALTKLAACADLAPYPPAATPSTTLPAPAAPASASSSGTTNAAPPARPAAPPPGVIEPPAFVLVRAGALLASAPPPAGHAVRLPDFSPVPVSPRTSTRFRLLRQLGDWVELETVTADPAHPHCHAPLTGFAGLALRLYAQARDLQAITVRRVRVPMGGGAVELEPGVPLIREGDRWRAFPDDNDLVVALPADAVGTWYRPALSQPIAAKENALRAEARISVGPQELKLGPQASTLCEWAAGRVNAADTYAQQILPAEAHRSALEAQTGCARYTGSVADSDVIEAGTPQSDGWPFQPLARNRLSARVGAPLQWSDGSGAGQVSGEVLIPDDANPDRQHPCFNRALDERNDLQAAALRLCLAPADLVESPALLSDQQVAVVTPRTRRQVTMHIENRTARASAEVDNLVRTAARRRLFALGDVVLTPPGEDEALSASRATRGALTRYDLRISVQETLGAAGGMSSRRVTHDLTRGDGTASGHPHRVHAGAPEQFQSAAGPVEEANALEAVIDAALWEAAQALRQDHGDAQGKPH